MTSTAVDQASNVDLHHREQDVGEARTSDVDEAIEYRHTQPPAIPEDSALDIDAADSDDKQADPSYDLPSFLSAPSTRVRRRSELAFSRPPPKVTFESYATTASGSNAQQPPPYPYSESYELPAITPPAIDRANFDLEDGASKIDSTPGPSAGPSRAPSLAFELDESTTALDRPSAAQRAKFRRFARLHLAALYFCFFLEGWNDGTNGPLLPRIQSVYGIGFAIVSMIFVTNSIGFVSGAAMNVHLSDRFGFGKVMLGGSLCQVVCYAMMIPEGPFAVRVIAYAIAGFGIALQNAGANGFVGSLHKHTERKLGFLHGFYGIGAFAAPLAATYFSTAPHWTYHYIISLGIAVTNSIILAIVFKGRTQDECMAEEGQPPGEVGESPQSKYSQIMRLKAVHALAIFSLIYVGVEVTLGGWIVTFIINERHGGPSAGYISSGFFGGLTVGRMTLTWLNMKIGEPRALVIYTIICIGLEATIWAVPSLIENAVAVSVIGVLMGPMYPIVVNHAKNVLPRWLLTGAIGWIAGIGIAGSAVLPLITGVLAARFGISSLQPFVVAMMGFMLAIWAVIPKAQRRAD